MNRKTKTIIFWIFAGIFITTFVLALFLGGIVSVWGAGTSMYNSVGKVLTAIGFNKSVVFKYSPFVCVGMGCILSFMFYKRYNTRIN